MMTSIMHRPMSGYQLIRLMLVCVSVAVFGSGCDTKVKEENERLKAEVQALNDAATTKEQYIQDVAASMDSVQNALEEIRQKEISTLKLTTNAKTDPESTGTKREQMLANVAGIRKILDERQQELTQLEARLEKLQGDNKGMASTIARLRKLITVQEGKINKLNEAIQSQNLHIAVLESVLGEKTALIEEQGGQLREKETVISQQAATLNTGYYVVGNKQDLKSKGILKEVGGVLGLGKAAVPSDLPQEHFTAVPIQETANIPLTCAPNKVQLVSTHVPGSFEVESAGKDSSILVIKDPATFWKTRYLVIMLKC